MGLGFLAPLFFAGTLLLVAPYLIHQIRRPEREPLRFSSVLFIPQVPKEIIERRRIQHLLLMLLRMLIFLILVFAFSRPFWKAQAAFDSEDAPSRHVILLDTSYSMGRTGVFESAKTKAIGALNQVKAGEEVAVVAFARSPRVLAPFATPGEADSGTVERARRAIQSATLTDESTAYLPALQVAQQMLIGADAEEEVQERRVIHLVSDFQRTGMPERFTGWKLASTIRLNALRVEAPEAPNLAVTDAVVRKTDGDELRVLGKIKNWSASDMADVRVTLYLNGEAVATNTLSVEAGNASQTSFRTEVGGDGPIEGYLELGPDALLTDNRRYFTWNPPRKRRVVLLGGETAGERYPASWFFEQALPNDVDLPWTTTVTRPDGLAGMLTGVQGQRPEVVIASGLNGFTEAASRDFLDYVYRGGEGLLTLNDGMDRDELNTLLLGALGLEAEELRFPVTRDTRFDLLSWVDFDHEVFVPFRGSRFNDFSSLRFYNHWVLTAPAEEDSKRVLARFDDKSPAMIELEFGAGRMMVWSFTVRLDWTNLPKNARFVPLLHETLAYMTDLHDAETVWSVGDRIPMNALVTDAEGVSVVESPNADKPLEIDVVSLDASGLLAMSHAGFFRTKAKGEDAWAQVSPVNVSAEEGDPAVISEAEFELKLATAPVLDQHDAPVDPLGRITADGFVIEKEYGRMLLALIVGLLVLESWYMCWLKR